MFLIYSIDAGNPRNPNERVVHCVDTDLADRFFVKSSTQGPRTLQKLVEDIDDFIGDQTRDLTKPLYLMGVDKDSFGAQVISEVVRKQPRYVTIKYATVNKAFRGGK